VFNGWVARLKTTRHGVIVGNVTGLLSASTLERVLLAVVLMVIARQVGPEEFGRHAGAFALTRILAVFFSLGLDNWLLRHGYPEGDATALARRATTCLLIKGAGGLVWLALITTAAYGIPGHSFVPAYIALAAAIVWFEELALGVWSAYKAAVRNYAILGWIIAAQAATLAVVVGLALSGRDTALPYLIGQALTTGVIALCALALFSRQWGFVVDWTQIAPTLRSAVPFAWSVGLALVYGRADIAIVAYVLGDLAAGLYAPAVSLATTVGIIPMALYTVMLPMLSKSYVQAPRQVIPTGNRLLLVSLALGLLAALALFLAAPWIVRWIYGEGFAMTGQVLGILSLVAGARFVGLAAAAILTAVDRQTQRVWVQAGVAILNVSLTLLLVARYGIIGVAWIFVATEWILITAYVLLFQQWAAQLDAKSEKYA
jgi:O-antigen/teichoic acid export membrane protein